MTLQAENKLEVLLDEFTDVHGTVLLGMHRELLSLKEDIDERLETHINAALAPINAADSALQAQLESAQRVIASLDEKAKLALPAIAAASEQLVRSIASARESLAADAALASEQLARHKIEVEALDKRFLETFAAKQRELQAELVASRSESQLILGQIGNQRSNFEQEVAQAVTRIAALQHDHQDKMSAALKVTDKLNSDSRAMLKAFRKRIESLHEREAAVRKRQRLEIIIVGLLGVGALAVGLWQTLPH